MDSINKHEVSNRGKQIKSDENSKIRPNQVSPGMTMSNKSLHGKEEEAKEAEIFTF